MIKITDELYGKMKQANKLQRSASLMVTYIDIQLENLGVDIQTLRNEDAGNFVDMVDYGRDISTKKDLEYLFNQHKMEDSEE